MTASLYIHIPFCVKKCAYCDFESYPGIISDADGYITRVLGEALDARKEFGITGVSTVYIGGGTPSLLKPEQLKRLAGGLFELFPPIKDAEISMEANPGTLNEPLLRAALDAGINRLSIGVQSADDRLLKKIGRIHSFEDARRSVMLAHDVGFGNISCDLMYGLPGQTLSQLEDSIFLTTQLEPVHISCYSLILEENTPLNQDAAAGRLVLPDEDTVCEMQKRAIRQLEGFGFKRYEISNYAVPGYECRHNTVYWTGGDYLGLGCAAHSFINGDRFSNPYYNEYMSGKQHVNRYTVKAAGRLEETLMLETRLTRGVSLNDIALRFGENVKNKLTASAGQLKDLVEIKDGFLKLTEEGFMLHNAVVYKLIEATE